MYSYGDKNYMRLFIVITYTYFNTVYEVGTKVSMK